MKQFQDYLRETYHDQDCYIDSQDRGWASYKVSGEECYIDHCYVDPQFRNTSAIYDINRAIEGIAKRKNCKFITGTVDLASKSPIRSVRS